MRRTVGRRSPDCANATRIGNSSRGGHGIDLRVHPQSGSPGRGGHGIHLRVHPQSGSPQLQLRSSSSSAPAPGPETFFHFSFSFPFTLLSKVRRPGLRVDPHVDSVTPPPRGSASQVDPQDPPLDEKPMRVAFAQSSERRPTVGRTSAVHLPPLLHRGLELWCDL